MDVGSVVADEGRGSGRLSLDRQLDATFAALADPTRRAMLARLAAGDATVNELAEPFELSLQAISKHLKVLERSGLISRGRHAQFRPCHLESRELESASEWIERQRRIWTERFDKFDQHLRDIQQAARPHAASTPQSAAIPPAESTPRAKDTPHE